MTEPQAIDVPVREGDVLAGKYRVERVIGVGGMGVVVAALHTELDQRVALKFLLPSAAQNPAVVARFSREARAAAKITSEHVARVSDVGTMDNGLPYIVMEYLEGHDLAQALTISERLPPGASVDYVLQACEALAEAHAAGFVHRDLKPGNLFLARRADGSAIIKVLDFGISKAVISEGDPASLKPGSLTKTTDVFGSPMYMSPEQLKSSRDVDPRADIWGLGVILYELISGKSPFDRETVAETFGAILHEKPASLTGIEGVSPALDAAVLRCLEKDASLRHQNVAELARALFPFAEHSTRQTLERTSRVLKRAGVEIDTLPPPPRAQAATNLSAVGAATRTSWGAAERAAAPRSARARTALFIGAGALLGGAAFLGAARYLKPRLPAPSVPATEGRTTAAPTITPSVAIVAPPAEPSVAPTTSASAPAPQAVASSAPLVVPGPPAPPALGKTWPVKTSLPAPPSPTALPALPPPPPPAATPAPRPAVKPPEDPNDFGDRK